MNTASRGTLLVLLHTTAFELVTKSRNKALDVSPRLRSKKQPNYYSWALRAFPHTTLGLYTGLNGDGDHHHHRHHHECIILLAIVSYTDGID